MSVFSQILTVQLLQNVNYNMIIKHYLSIEPILVSGEIWLSLVPTVEGCGCCSK